MRTRSRSRHKIAEPLRIEFPSQEDLFQEDPPEVLMADNRTMAQLLQAPTEGYEDAVVIPEIAANNFELKHGLINLVQNKQFFGHDKEDPHAHNRYFNKITSTMRVPNFFPPSKTTNLRNEITRFQQRFDESFSEAWDHFNDLLREDPPEVLMADNRNMAQLLQEPTEGYEDAVVIPEIAANNFELKHGLINLVQNKQFFGHDKEDPHAHIRYFNKITSTMRVPNVPNSMIKLMLFSFSLEGASRIWLEKELP
nr:hypothetical protein [Tanacetum cinerariifolium]